MQQLMPLLPVSGPEPRVCSSSSLPFLVKRRAILQEPPWTIVTAMDAVLVFCSVPFNTRREHLVMFMCLFIWEDTWQWRPKVWLASLLHHCCLAEMGGSLHSLSQP